MLIKQYWIVGGVYEDMTFTKVVPGTEVLHVGIGGGEYSDRIVEHVKRLAHELADKLNAEENT